MHILALAGATPHSRNPSKGIFYMRLLEEFARAGHEVTLLAPLKLGWGRATSLIPAGVDVRFISYLPCGRLRMGRLDGRRLGLRSFVRSAKLSARRLVPAPHAIFAHFFVPAGFAAMEIARETGIPAFCSLGESNCNSWFAWLKPAEVLARLADFRSLYPVSNEIAAFLRDRCRMPAAAIHIVPNAVDELVFHPREKQAARIALNIDTGRRIALFVGSADPRKGAQLLAAAAPLLPAEWEVWLVGPGHRVRNTSNSVKWAGVIRHSELALYYNAADVLVLPSEAEGMPNSVLEALACKLPVVVSRLSVTVEMFGENYPLYCERSAQSIAAKIVLSQQFLMPQFRVLTLREKATLILSNMASSLERS